MTLPVTLVTIATIHHELARMAVEDSMRGMEFEDVIVFTDKKEAVPDGARHIEVNVSNLHEYNAFLWYGLPFHVKTPFFLQVQWDGFIVNPHAWTDEFLNYDYIGAPWADYTVGNGGFSLRSVRLAKFIAMNPCTFKLTHPEDRAICTYHVDRLTKLGIRFAAKELASAFSFEAVMNQNVKDVFGFHGPYNFPRVLKGNDFNKRMKFLALEDVTKDNLNIILNEMVSEGKQLGYMKHEQERTQTNSST